MEKYSVANLLWRAPFTFSECGAVSYSLCRSHCFVYLNYDKTFQSLDFWCHLLIWEALLTFKNYSQGFVLERWCRWGLARLSILKFLLIPSFQGRQLKYLYWGRCMFLKKTQRACTRREKFQFWWVMRNAQSLVEQVLTFMHLLFMEEFSPVALSVKTSWTEVFFLVKACAVQCLAELPLCARFR